MTTDLRYPIGPEPAVSSASPDLRRGHIAALAELPQLVRDAVSGLSDEQLNTQYRPEGWTVRQVVHHLVDSHLNGYSRLKLALTERQPVIKPYDESAWARLADSQLPVDLSLAMLDGLHARWAAIYRAMTDTEFRRGFYHPERGELLTLEQHLQIYAWHGRHHVAHITQLRRRQGW